MAAKVPVAGSSVAEGAQLDEEGMDLDVDCWLVDCGGLQRSLQASGAVTRLAQFRAGISEAAQEKCSPEDEKRLGFPLNQIESDRNSKSGTTSDETNISTKSGERSASEIWRENHGNDKEAEMMEFWEIGAGNLENGGALVEGLVNPSISPALEGETTTDSSLSPPQHLIRSTPRQRSQIQVGSRLSPPPTFTTLTPPASGIPSTIDFQRKALLILNKKRQKTGRKPSSNPCLMCSLSLPYKKELIEHLKVSHGIDRSKSLMYKRLQQGKEEMERLYGGC